MNAAVEIPIRDNRRQAKFLYWMGWRVCDIADHLGEKDKTLHSWKDRDGWDRA
ncbi:TPA: terminase gpP N-terminus-related DNA-binding protein, partial [Pseudomonas aeruginosa]